VRQDARAREYERKLVLGNLEVLQPYLASQERYDDNLQKRCDQALSAWMMGEQEPKPMIEKLVGVLSAELPSRLIHVRKWLVEGYAMYRLASRLASWVDFEVEIVEFLVRGNNNRFVVNLHPYFGLGTTTILSCYPRGCTWTSPNLTGLDLPDEYFKRFTREVENKSITGKQILEKIL